MYSAQRCGLLPFIRAISNNLTPFKGIPSTGFKFILGPTVAGTRMLPGPAGSELGTVPPPIVADSSDWLDSSDSINFRGAVKDDRR